MTHQNIPVALITGASRGIGKAIAIALAEDGYQVCLLARSKDKLEETAQLIAENCKLTNDLYPLIYAVDVTNDQHIQNVITDITHKTNRIDILVNNAGMGEDGTIDLPLEKFKELVNVNLIAAFNIASLVGKKMQQQKSGYIFNVASLAGKRAVAYYGAYSATKFALVGLNDALFEELMPHNIKVTALCPGYVDTDMAADYSNFNDNEKIQTKDMVEAVRFLLKLSPSARVKEIAIHCKKWLMDNNFRT